MEQKNSQIMGGDGCIGSTVLLAQESIHLDMLAECTFLVVMFHDQMIPRQVSGEYPAHSLFHKAQQNIVLSWGGGGDDCGPILGTAGTGVATLPEGVIGDTGHL